MANLDEDVIELGSSDEETEPAPKKKKSIPNVMVQIPNKLPGITIKPANKPKINPISIVKANIGKAITLAQVKGPIGNKLSNPFANKNIHNGKTIVRKQTIQAHPAIANNPAITVVPTLRKILPLPAGKIPVKIAKGISTAPTLLRRLPSSSLPPGITVKRTSQLQSALKHNMKPNPANIQLKRKISNAKKTTRETVFVDLDDDDAAPSPVGPQWYLRPEEQEKKMRKSPDSKPVDSEEKTSEMETSSSKLENETPGVGKDAADFEEQNNREPETPKYIEITIEDSPAKPQPKRTCEVSEMAITIDDSPVKDPADKPAPTNNSDEEAPASKEKHSKKKLEYPKTANVTKTMEIEIELTPVEDASSQNDDNTDSQNGVVITEVVEIEESPMKPNESFHTSTPKKKLHPKPQLKMNDNKSVNVSKPQSKCNENKAGQLLKPQLKLNENKTPGEFNAVYQSFIDLCFRLENSEDMSKIVEKKIKAYYRQVPKEYTESEMFTDMVSSKINAMKAGPEKMYLYIKDVVDELNLQRKIAKTQPPKVVTINEEQEKFLYGEDSEFDSKRQRQIRKLEKTLKKLHRAIQKLEEQEVDFDDEEDSVYLLTESDEDTSKDIDQPFEKSELLKRYKERMIRVHAKFCQLTNTKMPSEPRVQIDARPGQPKGPAKRLEKWINKKVPIGTPLPFPDFHDVLCCVRDANQEDKLFWNEADIMEEARDLFTRCGKKLQRRRQENEWRLAASRIQSELDPAEDNDDLKKALEDNRRVASKKESEVLNKYADRQNQLNLEAVEIGDKEADESPVETDDDEPTEESTSLETKEKRKERLKRLLHKKSKKATEEQAQPNIDTNKCENDKTQVRNVKESGDHDHMDTGNKEKDLLSNKENDKKKDKHNTGEKDPLTEKINSDSDKIHSLSDDSNKIDSDIDELHLLQKLHSDVNYSSNPESSDSESPIAISDGLSSGDNRKQASDVISIENSSYSESEKNNEEDEIVSYSKKKIITESVDVQMEIECSNAGIEKKINKSNNDEYNESVEDILLASSDDEANKNTNLKDTFETDAEQTKNKNADTPDASSMQSIECITAAEQIIEKNTDNTEVTSTTFKETDDNDANTNTRPVEKNHQDDVVTSVKSAVPVEKIDNGLTEGNQDESVINPTENAETVNKVNNVKATEDEVTSKNKEVLSSKLTELVEGKITSLVKPDDADTFEVTDSNSTEIKELNVKKIKQSDHTINITEVTDEKSAENPSNYKPDDADTLEVTDSEVNCETKEKNNKNNKESDHNKSAENPSNDLPAAEPMEVDDINMT